MTGRCGKCLCRPSNRVGTRSIRRDGAAAVQALRSKAFDVVLLDIGLPFVDGWHVLSTFEGRRVPSVIVISARGDQADKVRALDMGADDYLAKPFGSDELLARIRAHGHRHFFQSVPRDHATSLAQTPTG